MEVTVFQDRTACGKAGAAAGVEKLRAALAIKPEANIILATGLSQFDVLHDLAAAENIDWNRVNAFHLDEYVGLPVRHPASFRLVLWKEFASQLPIPLKSFAWIDGENDPVAERARLAAAIAAHPIDIAFVGIGENGHLAFNDPPADFTTEEAYLTVALDEACRRQQMGEGWFKTLEDVPAKAISMSVKQIMKSKCLIVTVPDQRKAQGVKDSLEQAVSPNYPGSVMRTHPDAHMFLDPDSSSLLSSPIAVGQKRSFPVERK